MKLQDRVAIIACEGNEIDKAITNEFASEGATVVVVTNRLTASEEVLYNISSKETKTLALQTDISDEKQVQNLVAQTIKEYGQVDILVNNSAHMPSQAFDVADMSQEYWDAAMAVNLTGTMMCTKEVLKNMIPRQTGSIISISSIAGTTGDPGHSDYSASKWGIIGFTQSLAIEVGKYNIRVNSISPAATATEGFQNAMRTMAKQKGMSYEEFMDKMYQHYALRRIAEPSEIAKVALFLASDDASAVTGQNIIASCGFHMIHPDMIS